MVISKRIYRSAIFRAMFFVALFLLMLHLLLPYALLRYVENQINKIPEYNVKIRDLDVHLIVGSYTLKDLQLWKITKKIPVPFFSAEKINFSIQWQALFKGSLVGEIVAQRPIINFVSDPSGKNEQLTIDQQWLNIVKSLFPLNFNSIQARDGQVYLRSYHGKPPFNIYLKDVNLKIENMQNANRAKILLPSRFAVSAKTMDGAPVDIHGEFNPFAKQPTFNIAASLKPTNIRYANSFLKHYTSVRAESGLFSLYGEAVAADAKIKGYAKPFIKDLKILPPEKDASPIEALYEGAVAVVAKILENSEKKTIATKIKIEGDVDDPDSSILSIIGYMLRHAFIQALIPQIDNNVKMKDVIFSHKKSTANLVSHQ